MIERWLPCVGLEGRYEISDHGRIYSLPRERTKGGILKPWPDRDGYLTVCLAGKFVAVHRLVALAFHESARNPLHREVAHLDGDRANPCADNLKWVSKRENESHKLAHGTAQRGERATNVKLTAAQVREIRARGSLGPKGLAREFGVHASTIKAIRTGRLWRHLDQDCQARPEGIAQMPSQTPSSEN